MFNPSETGLHGPYITRKGGRMVASFRHPTKAATTGRMAFITVTS